MRPHHRLLRSVAFVSLTWSVIGACGVAQAQNIKWGPLQMTGGVQAGAEFLDNANTSPNHPKADVLLTLGTNP